MHLTDNYSQLRSIIWPVWLNGWVFVYKLTGCGFEPVAVTKTSDFASVLSKEFLEIQATIECGFTLKRVCDITRTYSLKINFYLSCLLSFIFNYC